MANITIRNIPDELFEQIKTLSTLEKRSINSELLLIIEKGTAAAASNSYKTEKAIPSSIQIHLWKGLAGRWEDDRPTEEIISEIYSGRTDGREINL